MVPEKIAGGARAVKVLTVSGVQESLQTMPIILPKKTRKGHTFYEVLTVHGNLGAAGGLAKIVGELQPPAGAIPD